MIPSDLLLGVVSQSSQGHIGIKGNEEVNGEAKRRQRDSHLTREHSSITVQSAEEQQSSVKTKQERKTEEKMAAGVGRLQPHHKIQILRCFPPSDRFIKLISDDKISRIDAS